jgi:hypothetical protein
MDGFKYDKMVQKALISVVKEVLKKAGESGLPGNHHFYIRFRTDHPNVAVPSFLKERHPEEVMIVIQHQFWDLKVFPDKFCVDLSFNNVRETLEISFSALTAFVDPSVKFALQFIPSFEEDEDEDDPTRFPKEEATKEPSGDVKIIDFDSFRKK